MIQALELRAAGASFTQIGKALSVSNPRAFRIVRKALDELVEHCRETAERVRQLELYRMDRIRLALDPKKADPRVADTLIRISERVAKLPLGLLGVFYEGLQVFSCALRRFHHDEHHQGLDVALSGLERPFPIEIRC
jgi:hypothetical protein